MKNEITAMNNSTICVFNDPAIGDMFASFSPDDIAGKVKLYNAINSPASRLGDVINTPINIQDVVVSRVMLSNNNEDNAGDTKKGKKDSNPFAPIPDDEKREGFRVVIIDTDGVSYTATSTGIYNSICTLRNVFGTLHFDTGLKAVVKQIQTKNGKTLTLSLVD